MMQRHEEESHESGDGSQTVAKQGEAKIVRIVSPRPAHHCDLCISTVLSSRHL